MAERCLVDTNPEVRKVLIDCLCKLPKPDAERLFARLVPIGDQGEIDAILEHGAFRLPSGFELSASQAFVRRMGVSAVKPLLNVLSERRKDALVAAMVLSVLPRMPLEEDVLQKLRAPLKN